MANTPSKVGLFLLVFLAMFSSITLYSMPLTTAQDIVGIAGFPLIGFCSDSDTLVKYVNFTVSGTEVVINQSAITCSFGCVENASQYGAECNDKNIGAGIVGLVVMGVAAAVLLIMALKLKFPEMNILFLIVSLFFLIGFMGLGVEITTNTYPEISSILSSAYLIMIFVTIFMVGIYIIRVLSDIIRSIIGANQEKKGITNE